MYATTFGWEFKVLLAIQCRQPRRLTCTSASHASRPLLLISHRRVASLRPIAHSIDMRLADNDMRLSGSTGPQAGCWPRSRWSSNVLPTVAKLVPIVLIFMLPFWRFASICFLQITKKRVCLNSFILRIWPLGLRSWFPPDARNLLH